MTVLENAKKIEIYTEYLIDINLNPSLPFFKLHSIRSNNQVC